MYDRNHYFGLGPILAILSVDTVTDTETTFQRENLVTTIMIEHKPNTNPHQEEHDPKFSLFLITGGQLQP